MATGEHEPAAAPAVASAGRDGSDTSGLSRRDILQLAGSAVLPVGMPTGTTRAATTAEEEAFAISAASAWR
jgi:hypothetical protein